MQYKCFTLDTVIFASSFLKTEEIKGKSGWWICTELLVAGGDELDNQQQSQLDSVGLNIGS